MTDYTCRHCGQHVTEPGHPSVCPVTLGTAAPLSVAPATVQDEVCSECGKPNPGHWCDGCGWQK